MPSNVTKNNRLSSIFSISTLDDFAKQSSLIQRYSDKFCAVIFLTSLIKAAISGKSSFRALAVNMGKVLPEMSKQSLWARFSKKSTAYLCSVHDHIMEQHLEPVRSTFINHDIQRILVEDSSHILIDKKNASQFPAHGNGHGQTAGVKIDLCYDLNSGKCVTYTLEKATEQDKAIGKETLDVIRPNDLVVRDMGYTVISEFNYIEQCGAHWLSRLPLTCEVVTLEGKSLESVLKKSKKAVVDIEGLLGAADQHKCRIVAIRADQNVSAERRRKRRLKADEKKTKVCPKGLVRDGWHIMVTSLSVDEASVETLAQIYRARWSIELQFRGIKQALHLTEALGRKTNKYHLEALILAAMIAHQVTMLAWNIYYTVLEEAGRMLSLEKLIASIIDYISELSKLDFTNYNPDIRNLAYDKRRANSALVNKAFQCLN